MKCPNCGSEVDTSICVACPHCKTRMPNANAYMPEIGMQDSYGNTMTVGGTLNKPRKKVSRKVIIPVVVAAVVLVALFIIGTIVESNKPRTYEEAIILARADAKAVVSKQLRYTNLGTWYANNYVEDNGDNKFIIYCDVYGELITGGYGRIQMYVGIELKKSDDEYTYWTTGNVYPFGDNPVHDNTAYHVQQLKEKMGW